VFLCAFACIACAAAPVAAGTVNSKTNSAGEPAIAIALLLAPTIGVDSGAITVVLPFSNP